MMSIFSAYAAKMNYEKEKRYSEGLARYSLRHSIMLRWSLPAALSPYFKVILL
jgi:hypothetical protein